MGINFVFIVGMESMSYVSKVLYLLDICKFYISWSHVFFFHAKICQPSLLALNGKSRRLVFVSHLTFGKESLTGKGELD